MFLGVFIAQQALKPLVCAGGWDKESGAFRVKFISCSTLSGPGLKGGMGSVSCFHRMLILRVPDSEGDRRLSLPTPIGSSYSCPQTLALDLVPCSTLGRLEQPQRSSM